MDRRDLDSAISELKVLLGQDPCSEGECQAWFERHPSVFEVLGYSEFRSKPALTVNGEVFRTPDLTAFRVAGQWEIVELKRPRTKILRDTQYRQTFNADFQKYLEQCREYVGYFADSAHRQEFEARHRFPIVDDPPILLIAGRSSDLDLAQVYSHLRDRSSNFSFYTYDQLLEKLEFAWRGTYGIGEGRPGVGLHMALILRRMSQKGTNFILDIGAELDRNRVSIFIRENDGMCLRVIDRRGRVSENVIYPEERSWQYDKWLYLAMELCPSAPDAYYLIECNGRMVNSGTSQELDFALPSPLPMVLGADLNGTQGSSCDVAELPILSATLFLADRHRMREYYYRKYAESFLNPQALPKRLEFSPGKFMFTESHPILGDPRSVSTSLVQPEYAHRPLFRERSVAG